MECVGAVLQFKEEQIFGNVNLEDLHPEIEKLVDKSRIPVKTINFRPNTIAKASFGFGDVNACVIFSNFKD